MHDARNAERDLERAHLHLVGARQRGAGRKLHDDDDVAAIDLRDEADRRLAEFVEAEAEHDRIDDEHEGRATHHA